MSRLVAGPVGQLTPSRSYGVRTARHLYTRSLFLPSAGETPGRTRMTPRLKIFLVLALTCALLVPLAPSAFAAKKMEVAVQDDFTLVNELPSIAYREKSLALATGLNATWVRANVNWNYVVG